MKSCLGSFGGKGQGDKEAHPGVGAFLALQSGLQAEVGKRPIFIPQYCSDITATEENVLEMPKLQTFLSWVLKAG